jgi:hypothetical protein
MFAERADRRAYARQPVNLPGTVLVPGKSPLPCTIRDVSKGGVMIALPVPAALPQRFVISVSGNVPVRRLCSLAWQDGETAGIAFVQPPKAWLDATR